VNSANKNTTVHGQFNTVADEHYKVQQNATQLFMKDKVYVESDGDIELRNGGTHYRATQGGKLTLTVSNEISVICGAARITLKKDGTIEMTGTKVKVGTVTNNTQYEPPGITVTAAKISQTAVGIHELQGAVVKIG
jgi:type VI secretion system secreted protein VgrG